MGNIGVSISVDMSANKLAPAMRRVFSAVGTFGDSSSSQSCIAHGDAQIPPRFRGRPAITALSHWICGYRGVLRRRASSAASAAPLARGGVADSLDEAKGRSGRPADWELADAGFRAWLESNIPGKLRRTGTLPCDVAVAF